MSGVNIMALGGVILAAASMVATFFAGSDMARISGQSRLLLAGSGSLLIAALILEFYA